VTDSEDKPRGFRTFLLHLNNRNNRNNHSSSSSNLLWISTALVTRHSSPLHSSGPELLSRDNSSNSSSSSSRWACQLPGQGVVSLIRLSRESTQATGRTLAGNKTRIPTSVTSPDLEPAHQPAFLPSSLNNLHDQFRYLSPRGPRPSRQHQDQTSGCFCLAEREASSSVRRRILMTNFNWNKSDSLRRNKD